MPKLFTILAFSSMLALPFVSASPIFWDEAKEEKSSLEGMDFMLKKGTFRVKINKSCEGGMKNLTLFTTFQTQIHTKNFFPIRITNLLQ